VVCGRHWSLDVVVTGAVSSADRPSTRLFIGLPCARLAGCRRNEKRPAGGSGCLAGRSFSEGKLARRDFEPAKLIGGPSVRLIWIRAAVRPLGFCMASGAAPMEWFYWSLVGVNAVMFVTAAAVVVWLLYF
jgi:hypothetical protein